MDLRKRIKDETRSLHEKIEKTYLFNKIMQKKITLCEYQLLIKVLYGFIAPCEDLIDSLKSRSVIKNRKKKILLEQDINALKISENCDVALPKCADLPVLSEHEYVLGYLYVMEGATLGGQIIAKMLKNQLQVTPDHGGRFFYGYGDETKMMWGEFCSFLCRIHSNEQQNKIIHSARSTFKKLYKWMENRSLSE